MTRGIQGIELGPYYNDNMTMKKERKLSLEKTFGMQKETRRNSKSYRTR